MCNCRTVFSAICIVWFPVWLFSAVLETIFSGIFIWCVLLTFLYLNHYFFGTFQWYIVKQGAPCDTYHLSTSEEDSNSIRLRGEGSIWKMVSSEYFLLVQSLPNLFQGHKY